MTLVLFDVLCLDGRSLVRLPWAERRSKLEWNVQPAPGLEISPTFEDGEELWRAVSIAGLEGLMAKRRNSVCRPGERSPAWVKVKTKPVTELVVGGWIEGLTGGLAAVMLAEPTEDGLVFRGHAAYGLAWPEREALREWLLRCERSECPPRGAAAAGRVVDARAVGADSLDGAGGAGAGAEQCRRGRWTAAGCGVD